MPEQVLAFVGGRVLCYAKGETFSFTIDSLIESFDSTLGMAVRKTARLRVSCFSSYSSMQCMGLPGAPQLTLVPGRGTSTRDSPSPPL